MDKPSSILYKEFRGKIIEAINTSGLPAFVINLTLSQLLKEVQALEEKQLNTDLDSYNAALAELSEEEGSEVVE